MRRSFIAFIIFIISGAALSAQSGDRDLRLTMKNQGYEREYRLYIPEGVGEGSPLVIALHGYGGGIEKMPSALITTAKAHGYAICIPQGLKDPAGKPGWNVGYPSQEGMTVDDVDFVCSLARKLRKEYGFSKSATFLTGMSNGGEMCYLTAMRKPKAFTAVASIAGLSLLWMFEKYPVSGPVPFMEVHGTEDRTSEWPGQCRRMGSLCSCSGGSRPGGQCQRMRFPDRRGTSGQGRPQQGHPLQVRKRDPGGQWQADGGLALRSQGRKPFLVRRRHGHL